MLKDPRNFLWLLPLTAIVTLPLWKPIAASYLRPVPQQTAAPLPALSNQHMMNSSTMTGIQFEQNKNGSKEWLLTADHLSSLEGDPNVQLDNVQALFFNKEKEQGDIRIVSQRASYNTETGQISLAGRVTVNNDQGYEMQTESLQYIAAEKKIRTTSPVTVQGSNFKISGDQLVYNTITGNYRVSGNVSFFLW